MSSPSQAYLDASAERLRKWQDKHLSVEAPRSPAPEPPAPPAEIYRQPLFPPAALRPWSRPLIKPRR